MSEEVLRERKELEELLYRFAWKWAVLAYYAGKLVNAGYHIPREVINDLSLLKSKIDSGCYSVCEIMRELRGVEARLLPLIIELGRTELDSFLCLVRKAISGDISRDEVDLEVAKPVLTDCKLPCICDRRLRSPAETL